MSFWVVQKYGRLTDVKCSLDMNDDKELWGKRGDMLVDCVSVGVLFAAVAYIVYQVLRVV